MRCIIPKRKEYNLRLATVVAFCLLIVPSSGFAAEMLTVIQGNTINIYRDENGVLHLGRDGAYLVRYRSLTPTPFAKVKIPENEFPAFRDAIKKAVEWCELNKKEKMSFSKEIYRYNTRDVVINFTGCNNSCSISLNLHTSNYSETGVGPDEYERFDEMQINKIYKNISDEAFEEYKVKQGSAKKAEEARFEKLRKEKEEEKARIDAKFK